MPVERTRLESLSGRTVDLVCEGGCALVGGLGGIEDCTEGEPRIRLSVLAVERRGRGRTIEPGDSITILLRDVRAVRPVIFVSGSGY